MKELGQKNRKKHTDSVGRSVGAEAPAESENEKHRGRASAFLKNGVVADGSNSSCYEEMILLFVFYQIC